MSVRRQFNLSHTQSWIPKNTENVPQVKKLRRILGKYVSGTTTNFSGQTNINVHSDFINTKNLSLTDDDLHLKLILIMSYIEGRYYAGEENKLQRHMLQEEGWTNWTDGLEKIRKTNRHEQNANSQKSFSQSHVPAVETGTNLNSRHRKADTKVKKLKDSVRAV